MTFRSMRRYLVALSLLILAIGGAGCGNNDSGSSPTPTPTPAPSSTPTPAPVPLVDMAVGTKLNNTVLIYLDVLAGDSGQKPEVVLDNAGSKISQPRSMVISNGDLYVANIGNGTVAIFRNYLSLSNGQAPSAVLTSTVAGIRKPKQILIVNDTLIVNNGDVNEILLFKNASSITTDVAPDVSLDNAGSGIRNPTGIAVAGNTLYVANAGDNKISIFDDITSLTTGQAPDARLDNAGSSVDFPKKLFVANNILYVFQSFSDTKSLLVFSPADGLTNGQAPDAILRGDTSGLDTPNSGLVIGNRLFVGNRRTDSLTAGPALQIFDNADGLASGQMPALSLGPNLFAAEELAQVDGYLFAADNSVSEGPGGFGAVAIYSKLDALSSSTLPTIFLDDFDLFGGSQVGGLAVNAR